MVAEYEVGEDVRILAEEVDRQVIKRGVVTATSIQANLIYDDLDITKLDEALDYLVETERLIRLVPQNPRRNIIGMANTYYVPNFRRT